MLFKHPYCIYQKNLYKKVFMSLWMLLLNVTVLIPMYKQWDQAVEFIRFVNNNVIKYKVLYKMY